ncbi:NuA4-domain-containing protein [Dacryopinax primogenitus]|uniref:Chromatin modification-related protein EAF6 n=1 Tax=Dacryopinax primogenitus (strain DJM 731) TaxID=1858805 RepID=M5GAW8_DACPD|nr:NuA4-domain-containing protein [Dacryopinax primogenitus]EJU03127.1 NuA4-domain-containing protein [Dacryopinax primogenitus]
MPIYANPKTEYEESKKLLVKALNEKRKIDSELVELERAIFTYEGAYLTDTANSGGNIMQGFENFLKPNHPNKKRIQDVGDGDRLFSSSSATYRKVCKPLASAGLFAQDFSLLKALSDDKTPTPARTASPTPSIAGSRADDGTGKKGIGRGKAGALFGKRPQKRKPEDMGDTDGGSGRKKKRLGE